jgi:hypothetical protein
MIDDRSARILFIEGPSSPDYQHSPSNSHCSSNHNPSSIQSNPLSGTILYDKLSASTSNHADNGTNPRTLLATSKPNLRSFTVPVAPPIIPPPPMSTKHQVPIVSSNCQCRFRSIISTNEIRAHNMSILILDKSPFRSPNRTMLNNYSKDMKSMPSDDIDANPADVLEDVRNQLGNLMKKDFQC